MKAGTISFRQVFQCCRLPKFTGNYKAICRIKKSRGTMSCGTVTHLPFGPFSERRTLWRTISQGFPKIHGSAVIAATPSFKTCPRKYVRCANKHANFPTSPAISRIVASRGWIPASSRRNRELKKSAEMFCRRGFRLSFHRRVCLGLCDFGGVERPGADDGQPHRGDGLSLTRHFGQSMSPRVPQENYAGIPSLKEIVKRWIGV